MPSEGFDTEADIGETRREGGTPPVNSGASYAAGSPWTALNERQQKAMPTILQKGGVTRREYQKMFDGGMSSRTALYDLKDLVEKGFLQKMGLGPATRYVPRK
jgi:predicted HTH transcriptional regulator